MKKILIYSALICALLNLNSCSHSKYVKTNGNDLIITDFDCGIGIVGINVVHGDFETLDREVFNTLKGKSGSYSIVMIYHKKDSYGNNTAKTNNIGEIDANEINKYQEVSYWTSSTGGMQSIIFHR